MSKLSKWWAESFDCPHRKPKSKNMVNKIPTRKIGEIIELNGISLQVCKGNYCKDCFFNNPCSGMCECSYDSLKTVGYCKLFRSDEEHIIFKEVKTTKTKGQIIEHIQKQPWFDAFCRNCILQTKHYDLVNTSDINLISTAFRWDETPEGFYFWDKIDSEFRKWYRYEGIKELTLEEIASKFGVSTKQIRIKD